MARSLSGLIPVNTSYPSVIIPSKRSRGAKRRADRQRRSKAVNQPTIPQRIAWLVIAASALFTSGCASRNLLSSRTPSLNAHFVQKWAFADFARDVEGKASPLNLSGVAAVAPDDPVVLVPSAAGDAEAFSEMKRLSRTGDEVSEFVEPPGGRYFFCLTRDGRIVRTFEFENRAPPPVNGGPADAVASG
jgi:hypothetical protein